MIKPIFKEIKFVSSERSIGPGLFEFLQDGNMIPFPADLSSFPDIWVEVINNINKKKDE